jgi:diamine N-acetyltransferase
MCASDGGIAADDRSRHGMKVHLREITAQNVRMILDLQVTPEQRNYVASNAVSLAEAQFNPGAWFRAVYAGDEPVGFVMLFDPTAEGAVAKEAINKDEIGLWRLMIDQRYQRRGFGQEVLDLICADLRSRREFKRMLSSYVPGEHGPEAFYLSYGFTRTGRRRNGGLEMEIVLLLQ